MSPVQTVEALAAGRDSTDDDPLADCVETLEARPQLFDHADRLVAEHQTGLDGVFAAHDVDICSADRGRRNANDRFTSSGAWLGHLFDGDLVFALEHDRLHHLHNYLLPGVPRGYRPPHQWPTRS